MFHFVCSILWSNIWSVREAYSRCNFRFTNVPYQLKFSLWHFTIYCCFSLISTVTKVIILNDLLQIQKYVEQTFFYMWMHFNSISYYLLCCTWIEECVMWLLWCNVIFNLYVGERAVTKLLPCYIFVRL